MREWKILIWYYWNCAGWRRRSRRYETTLLLTWNLKRLRVGSEVLALSLFHSLINFFALRWGGGTAGVLVAEFSGTRLWDGGSRKLLRSHGDERVVVCLFFPWRGSGQQPRQQKDLGFSKEECPLHLFFFFLCLLFRIPFLFSIDVSLSPFVDAFWCWCTHLGPDEGKEIN